MATQTNGLNPPSIGRAEPLKPPTTDRQRDAAAPPAPPAPDIAAAIRGNAWGARDASGATFAARLAGRVAARRNGIEAPIPTPWENVNRALGGGVWPGLHVLVGATGSGKSQLAMQLALHAAKTAGVPVLYLALELDAFGLFCRAVATLAWGRVREEDGRPASPQWSALYTGAADVPPFAVAELEALPFRWLEAPPHGFGYDALAPAVEALRAEHNTAGPVMLVVDFLQLVSSPDTREELRERIGHASYACRAIARELNAVVLALSSTARRPPGDKVLTVEGGDDGSYRRTALHDLVGLGKESGDVEFSADSVMVLCRETWPDGEPPPVGGRRVHLAVAKLRAGVPSWSVLTFNGTTFAVASEDTPEAPSTPAEGRRKLPPRKRGKPRSSAPPEHDPRDPRDEGEDE